MASGSTPRLGLPYPLGTDPPNIPGDVGALAARLDSESVVYLAGALAGRPAPGTSGRIYFATDTGVCYFDTGGAWVSFQPTLAELQAILGLTTPGDLLVMGPSGPVRLPVGSDGKVLTARSTATNSVDWEAALASSSTSYTPIVNGGSIGNGTIAGYYLSCGAWAQFAVTLTCGSTTPGFLSGIPAQFSLPVPASPNISQCVLAAHESSNLLTGEGQIAPGSSVVRLWLPTNNTPGAAPTDNWSGMTVTPGDKFVVSGSYLTA